MASEAPNTCGKTTTSKLLRDPPHCHGSSYLESEEGEEDRHDLLRNETAATGVQRDESWCS